MQEIDSGAKAAIPPVSQYLTAMGVPHQVFRHPGSVTSLEQAAAERGQAPKQVVRSILFRLAKGEYAMVLIAGPGQISWPNLRAHFGQSRLTMAKREEVLQVTGYELGAVAPFGIPDSVRVLVDQGLLDQEEVSLGSGVRHVAIMIRVENLLDALDNIELGRFEAGEDLIT